MTAPKRTPTPRVRKAPVKTTGEAAVEVLEQEVVEAAEVQAPVGPVTLFGQEFSPVTMPIGHELAAECLARDPALSG